MLLSTTPTIEGRRILEYKGIVTGETIVGANAIKDFMAGLRDFFGGRSGTYEKVLREAKEAAMRARLEKLSQDLSRGTSPIVRKNQMKLDGFR